MDYIKTKTNYIPSFEFYLIFVKNVKFEIKNSSVIRICLGFTLVFQDLMKELSSYLTLFL